MLTMLANSYNLLIYIAIVLTGLDIMHIDTFIMPIDTFIMPVYCNNVSINNQNMLSNIVSMHNDTFNMLVDNGIMPARIHNLHAVYTLISIW